MSRPLELRLVSWKNADFRALVQELDQEYIDRFGDIALQYRQYNGLETLEQACLLVKEGRAVACGAYQRLDEATAELLELQALFGGYTEMALETGRDMPEAISLYTSMGYRETPAWGPFVGDKLCICMAKELQ